MECPGWQNAPKECDILDISVKLLMGLFFYWKGMIVDCDTRGNIEGETKEITLRTLNKILCDTIDKALGDAGVINIRVEVLDDDNSM